MYKLILIVLMMGIWATVQALQTDEELALQLLDQGKRAVNRAAHAGAQQIDRRALADGIVRLDPELAFEAASQYLQSNLLVDGNGEPLPGSPLRDAVEVLVFDVINDEHDFPYTYRNEAYGYETTLRRPGVVIIMRMSYPRAFAAMKPIEWEIKGAAELVMNFR